MTGRQPPFRFMSQEPPPRRTVDAVRWLLRGGVAMALLLVAHFHGWLA